MRRTRMSRWKMRGSTATARKKRMTYLSWVGPRMMGLSASAVAVPVAAGGAVDPVVTATSGNWVLNCSSRWSPGFWELVLLMN